MPHAHAQLRVLLRKRAFVKGPPGTGKILIEYPTILSREYSTRPDAIQDITLTLASSNDGVDHALKELKHVPGIPFSVRLGS